MKKTLDNQRGLYLITNETAGKVYIGATEDRNNRFTKHDQKLLSGKHHNCDLQEAFNKGDKLELIFLGITDDVSPFKLETELIKEFKNSGILYNKSGVDPSPSLNRVVSEETKLKQRNAKLGTVQSEETKLKRADSNRGQKRSDESKARMSSGQMGNTNLVGYKYSDEHKAKLSAIALVRGTQPNKEARENALLVNSKIVIIDGIEYSSIVNAAAAYGASPTYINTRLKSDNFPNWYKK
jgi:group I intron endonuclease